MNTVALNKISIDNVYVLQRLKTFLDRFPNYKGFTSKMSLFVFSYGYKADFVAFETKEYNYSFISAEYKPSHMLLKDINRTDTNYEDFRAYLDTLTTK